MKQSTADKLLLKMLFFVLLSVIEPLETKMQQQRQVKMPIKSLYENDRKGT